jgi:4-hydroxythreonine-4-phosphate dehydrogenase
MIDDWPLVGISAGEPAGIGPDLCASLYRHDHPAHLVIVADANLIEARAKLQGLNNPFPRFNPEAPAFTRGQAQIWHQPLPQPAVAGRPNAAHATTVLHCLDLLIQGCATGMLNAMVTAPIQKSTIEEGGIPFTGHTEYIAQALGVPRVVMMLTGGGLRVALATTHLPLAEVPAQITQEGLLTTLKILHEDLKSRFHCHEPRIRVTGLNPHAGESGHLGREEIDTIIPAMNRARSLGMKLEGPVPADTAFLPDTLEAVDCILAMYHDQGLPALKMRSFGQGVNVTLGLPIIRTSVDHGTALDRAAQPALIDQGSLRAAITTALEMIGTRP